MVDWRANVIGDDDPSAQYIAVFIHNPAPAKSSIQTGEQPEKSWNHPASLFPCALRSEIMRFLVGFHS